MQEHVTLLPPDARAPGARGISSTLPPDLLEQVRGRVGLLALLILVAFSFDPLLYIAAWIASKLGGFPVQFGNLGFRLVDLGAVAASAALWWASRNRSISPSRLHTVGLLYEITICFIVALVTFWSYYREYHIIPNLTWVPAIVILFPLILPGPPRRMLAAAVAAGAMPLLALLVLELSGKVSTAGGGYLEAAVSSTFAVGVRVHGRTGGVWAGA